MVNIPLTVTFSDQTAPRTTVPTDREGRTDDCGQLAFQRWTPSVTRSQARPPARTHARTHTHIPQPRSSHVSRLFLSLSAHCSCLSYAVLLHANELSVRPTITENVRPLSGSLPPCLASFSSRFVLQRGSPHPQIMSRVPAHRLVFGTLHFVRGSRCTQVQHCCSCKFRNWIFNVLSTALG